jgi:hypothetical protein
MSLVGGTGGTSSNGVHGGDGGTVAGTVSVTPGETLTVIVAGNGSSGSGRIGGAGGYGGGAGGAGDPNSDGLWGSGGGGASSVYEGSTPLVVAGGGGGDGFSSQGGGAGQKGAGGQENCPGGGAGTQTGPGTGASFDGYSGSSGAGIYGGGGGIFEENSLAWFGGGGGGAGYYGGGGGVGSGGGGGSSYPPADVTGFDTTSTPSVTITYSFAIATTSLPNATPGAPYGPVTLTTENAGVSTSPYSTTFKWTKVSLPKGMKLLSAGVLYGTPNKKLPAGASSVTIEVTETVTTLEGKKHIKTKTTVEATIPLTIN